MADFIDKQATMNAVGLTTDAINFNPTKYVDAQGNELVAVVHCKDCKFYWKNSRNVDGVVCLATPRDDAFCSEGERREDA